MSYIFDPNRNPFSRKTFADVYQCELDNHRLERGRLEPVFKALNPTGYQHDLGAADVFLDNLGMLFKEQAEREVWSEYERVVRVYHSDRWLGLKQRVLPHKPWWGAHYNSARHRANAGNPRGLLRLLTDDGLRWTGESSESLAPLNPSWPREGLLPDAGSFGVRPESALLPGGVLPEVAGQDRAAVPETRILPPDEATPDLRPRVGMTTGDLRIYTAVGRDQGILGTCAAHTVSVAMDVLVRRQRTQMGLRPAEASSLRFSPAWIHCASGEARRAGRTLSAVVDAVRRRLPCSERSFPYPIEPTEQTEWVTQDIANWETPTARAESDGLTSRLPPLEVVRISNTNISRIKAYLAAGWVIALGTYVTEEWLSSPGLQQDGLPLTPLPGHRRAGGHGWLLVGYDHVDGNHQWKYQGRFFALSSWGPRYPRRAVAGPGVFTLPFAMPLTEGIDAYAMRFAG